MLNILRKKQLSKLKSKNYLFKMMMVMMIYIYHEDERSKLLLL